MRNIHASQPLHCSYIWLQQVQPHADSLYPLQVLQIELLHLFVKLNAGAVQLSQLFLAYRLSTFSMTTQEWKVHISSAMKFCLQFRRSSQMVTYLACLWG